MADVGSSLLCRPESGSRTPGSFTGRQIVAHFLKASASAVDAVIMLTPSRDRSFSSSAPRPVRWRATTLTRPGLQLQESGVASLLAFLPMPRFEGYQARSLHQQAAYRPDGYGWYIGTSILSTGTTMTFKISTRALLDLLADRITLEQFRHSTGLKDGPGATNIFRHRLDQGDILSDVKLESGGLDEDDDWLVIEFRNDPSVAQLRVPER